MAAEKRAKTTQKVEKKSKKGEEVDGRPSKEERKMQKKKQAATTALSLLADNKSVDPALSSLFAAKVDYWNSRRD